MRSSNPDLPPIGEAGLQSLTTDDVADWSESIQLVLAPTTAKATLRVLDQILRFAVRRGWSKENPCSGLDPSERPYGRARPVRILEPRELAKLLEHSGRHRLLFEFLAYTGLRVSEALGLRLCDLDLEAGLVRVRQQLSHRRLPKPLKTEAARREVVLAPQLVPTLRQHLLVANHREPDDLVFATASGRGLDYVKIWEAFAAAVRRAGLASEERLSPHCLRHSFASLLIGRGLDVAFVASQLGHTNPTTTLSTYTHLIERADHTERAREALQASFATATGALAP